MERKKKVEKKRWRLWEAREAHPKSIPIESENSKSLRGSLPCLPFPSPPYFILYLNSLLLATFYTLSFIDYIHVYPR